MENSDRSAMRIPGPRKEANDEGEWQIARSGRNSNRNRQPALVPASSTCVDKDRLRPQKASSLMSPMEEEDAHTDSTGSTGPGGEEVTSGASTAELPTGKEEADEAAPLGDDGWTQVPGRKAKKDGATVTTSNAAAPKHQDGCPEGETMVPKKTKATAPMSWNKTNVKYEVGIRQDEDFNLMRRLLVPGGGEIKRIAQLTGAQLTVRGKGSGHLEGPQHKEVSDEPLMIWICSAYPESLAGARSEVEVLVRVLHEEYRVFCKKRRLPEPELTISPGVVVI
jgi:hypothetical protein